MTKRIISAINVTPLAFPAGAPPGTPIAQVTIQMSSGLFSTSNGTLTIAGASASDFRAPRLNVSGSYTLLSAITIPSTWNPFINLVAAQPGIANSPLTSSPYSFAPIVTPSPPPPPPPSPPPPSPVQTLLPGTGGSLTTPAGNWTINPTNPPGDWCVFLNGSYQGGIGVKELAVANSGNLYGYWIGTWWKWTGTTFVVSTDPNMPPVSPPSPPPPPPPSPPTVTLSAPVFTYIPYIDVTGHTWPAGQFPPNVSLGTLVARITSTRSDGQPFTGHFEFTTPNLDYNGAYSLRANLDFSATLLVNPTGPGVGGVPSFEHVTVRPIQP